MVPKSKWQVNNLFFENLCQLTTCVYIGVSAHPIKMPGNFVAKTHFQAFQVAKHAAVDRGHFVAVDKCTVCLLQQSSFWIWAKSPDIFIKEPAFILVENVEEKYEFFINIRSDTRNRIQGSSFTSQDCPCLWSNILKTSTSVSSRF